MAYYDHEAAEREMQRKEKFEELKSFIKSKDENGKLSEWFLAYEYILSMEKQLKKQEETLGRYRSFFSLLSELTPKQPSIHDIIG